MCVCVHVYLQSRALRFCSFYRPQRSCEGYVFTRVCLSTGGSTWAGTPRTRYTPRDQVHPQETATVADGTHPIGMHSCYWPQRSCGQGSIFTPVCHSVHGGGLPQCMRDTTPQDQTPPQTRQTPPLTRQTPPPPPGSRLQHTVYCCGWYASYWNAFLLRIKLNKSVMFPKMKMRCVAIKRRQMKDL